MKKSKFYKAILIGGLLLSFLSLAGCSANIGVGLNVSVPVGKYGHVSIGSNTGRWY